MIPKCSTGCGNECSRSWLTKEYNSKCSKDCTGPSVKLAPLCIKIGCMNECHINQQTGEYYKKCSRTCPYDSPMCSTGCGRFCQERPTGGFYEKCNKTCGDTDLPPPCSVCIVNPCQKKVFDPKGGYYSKCCKGCGSPTHHEIDVNDDRYFEIVHQFTGNWKKPGTPKVKHVICLESDTMLEYLYKKHQNSVFTDMKERGIPNKHKYCGPGNELRRFHGTKQECSFGLDGNMSPCSDSNCYSCCIIKSGFKIHRSNTKFERFGFGVYITATSGKSNDYSRGDGLKGLKSVFVCKVIAGKGMHLSWDDEQMDSDKLTKLGYHSVIGETKTSYHGKLQSKQSSKQQNLNFDELVVYVEYAIIPIFLIVYDVK